MVAGFRNKDEIMFPVKNHLNGSSASTIGIYLNYLVEQGARKIRLDFSRVRNFEYFGMAVLTNIILQYKKNKDLVIRLCGLSAECSVAIRYFGLEKLIEM